MTRIGALSLCLIVSLSMAAERAPLHTTVDLARGEVERVRLRTGKPVTLMLWSVDSHLSAAGEVDESSVDLEIDGKRTRIPCGNYNLPVTLGAVQIDCTVTRVYKRNASVDWGLKKDARVRLWPSSSAWIEPGTFIYPAGQKWFASLTQMANEPVHSDVGDHAVGAKIYYHTGLDMGGAEKEVDVIAATNGQVVSLGDAVMPEHAKDTPAQPRYDVIYVLDDRGWYYRYSHLASFTAGLKLGDTVRMGQKLGKLGKEGASGGWSHLHFEIIARQPSGLWGTEEGYAFLWETYVNQFKPKVMANARPHRVIKAGETVTFDCARSWTADGNPHCIPVTKTYPAPGMYTEVLKVTDSSGNTGYDFGKVLVMPVAGGQYPPTIHAAYYPTTGIKAGKPVTFLVRSFTTATEGDEVWDFADGSDAVRVHSDGGKEKHAPDGYVRTSHSFSKPGTYLVKVSRANATTMLAVEVQP